MNNPNKKIKLNITKNISTFFTYTIINNYNKNINLQGKYRILNLEQMYEKLNILNGQNEEYNIAMLQQSLPNLVCKSISKKYIFETINNSTMVKENIDYDICFLINDLSENNKFEEIIKGFLVVHRNQCPKYPNVYCLKLVCALEQGQLLVGCYLYSILSHPNLPIDFNKIKKYNIVYPLLYPENNDEYEEPYYGTPIEKIGLLELSGSYKNINALCLYSKFGFKEDKKLRGYYSNCFIEENNLPMIVIFEGDAKTNINKIIKIVKKEEEIYKKHIICQITDKKLQKILIKLYLLRDKRVLEISQIPKLELETITDLERRISNLNRDIKLLEDNPQQKIEGNVYFEECYNNLYGVEKCGKIKNKSFKITKKRRYANTNKTRKYKKHK